MQSRQHELLDASTLCAIATVSPRRAPHVNTAYFAWSPDFQIIWLSDPGATHSRNLRKSTAAAIAVYDSTQTWGQPDRGIQLSGTACEVPAGDVTPASTVYSRRFAAYEDDELSGYRFHRFRPQRLKLFDEKKLGAGIFVTARVDARGRLAWDRTEIYG